MALETASYDPSYRVRLLTELGLRESATLCATVILASAVLLVGGLALVLAQAGRLPRERQCGGAMKWWWGASVLLALLLGYLPLAFGASSYLGELVAWRQNGSCGDPAVMLVSSLEDIASAEAEYRNWATFAAFGGCVALVHAAWSFLRGGEFRAFAVLRSWRWALLISGCCWLCGGFRVPSRPID